MTLEVAESDIVDHSGENNMKNLQGGRKGREGVVVWRKGRSR